MTEVYYPTEPGQWRELIDRGLGIEDGSELLASGEFPFDCLELRDNVLDMIEIGEGRFRARYSRKYADWALRFV